MAEEKAKEGTGSPELLSVVEYTLRDSLLGGESRQLGVLVEVGDKVGKVIPLATHHVQVDLADVVALSADDV